MGVLSVTLLTASLMSVFQDSALAPSASWELATDPNGCTIARRFGPEQTPTIIQFRPRFPGQATTITVLTRPDTRRAERLQGHMLIEPAGVRYPVGYTHGPDVAGSRHVIQIDVDIEGSTLLAGAQRIALPNGARRSIAFDTGDLSVPLKRVQDCFVAVMQRSGINPAELRAPATPAAPIENGILWRGSDFPKDAVAKVAGRVSFIGWRIDAHGRVTHCRALESGGDAELDDLACAAVLERAGRYRPARDPAGDPTPSWASRRLVWLTR